MEIPNAFYRVSVKALILNEEGKFLLAQEKDGSWELLGGGLNFEENPQEGLIREIAEETGLQVETIEGNPSYFVTAFFEPRSEWKANVLYTVTLKDLNFAPSDECVALKFFSKEEVQNVKTLSNVDAFAKIFKPENHE